MADGKYAAGLHFLVTSSNDSLKSKDRTAINSHATKARWRERKQAAQLRSWINPDRRLGPAKEKTNLPVSPTQSTPMFKRVGGDFSALRLPLGIEPFMISDIAKFVDLNKLSVYHYEACLEVHVTEREWWPYMLSDRCCIHSLMFSIQAFTDMLPHNGKISRKAAFHHDRALQLLRARLYAFEGGQRDAIYGDSTIMVIFFLVSAAQLMGDFEAAENHMDGLLKIVSLRGGVRLLNASNNMQVKVCRTDLDLALRVGRRPRLYHNEIAWGCFLADRGLIRCKHEPFETQIRPFVSSLDRRLGNVFKDLHAFACMSNLAYQTTGKLSPDTYNEAMASTLYRLTHLSFEHDALQEAIRAALLFFASTIFLTRIFMHEPYENLSILFRNALSRLYRCLDAAVPPSIMLWLMFISRVEAGGMPFSGEWESKWFGKAVLLSQVDTWPQAGAILRSVMWIGFLHDEVGEKAFEEAVNSRREV